MPWLIYPVMACVLVGLGFAIHPEQSLSIFTLWTVSIAMLRSLLYYGYIIYYLGSDFSWQLFPFNLFSHEWRSSKPRWIPLNSRQPDSLNHATLCEQCTFVDNSGLILGSESYFVRMVEWHDFGTRKNFVNKFEDKGRSSDTTVVTSNSPNNTCQFCTLLWHSLTPRRQAALNRSIRTPSPEQPTPSDLLEPEDRTAELRVKVWEERPLSRFTYAQLHWGETAIGARLLVHRDKLFATRKSLNFFFTRVIVSNTAQPPQPPDSSKPTPLNTLSKPRNGSPRAERAIRPVKAQAIPDTIHQHACSASSAATTGNPANHPPP